MASVGRGGAFYDRIGTTYATGRRTEPRIAAQIHAALGDAATVLNVGAGTGSYEPADRDVTAVEPSAVMRAQRPPGSAPCVAAAAEQLPFADASFDAALAVLSDHHWDDPIAGLREMARVARRVVVFQWDPIALADSWLVREYVPEVVALSEGRPTLAQRAEVIGAQMTAVPVPADCVDGFFSAFWARPHAYLDERVRRTTSVWARVGEAAERRAVDALDADVRSGAWHDRHGHLLELSEADVGARLLVSAPER